MHDFGKLTGKTEIYQMPKPDGTTLDVPYIAFYDANGVEWHEVFKAADPFDWYVAFDDLGRVVSMEADPEHSQMADRNIYGLSTAEVGDVTRGPGGSVYGLIWNGTTLTAPELTRAEYPTLTPRQLWLTAGEIGITKNAVLSMVDAMEDQQAATILRIELTETVNFERSDPAVDQMASLMGVPGDQLDALWLWAAAV